VRFVYRIGLTDEAAMAATYNSANIPGLIRSTASRILVHDFASRTLDELLGEQRTQLAADIGTALQRDLKKLNSGVEILATVVESIHPPAGAADAYHAVQAAQISAQALISRERGLAANQANLAQLHASVAHDDAVANSRDVMATAQSADLRFSAEQQGYAKAGQAFLLEQYLSQLTQGLTHAKLLILDHRLGGNSAPTIDLRTFTLPADPATPARAVDSPAAVSFSRPPRSLGPRSQRPRSRWSPPRASSRRVFRACGFSMASCLPGSRGDCLCGGRGESGASALR
jgi:regulator of protease activity HflC (stomatin/prohibitin superfamily)